MSRSRSTSPLDTVRAHAPTGAVFGATSFLLSYVLTYAFVVIDGVDTSDGGWTLVGLVLYSAHNVETVASASGVGGSVTGSFNLIHNSLSEFTDLGSAVPTLFYYLVPVVALLVAGFLTVRVVDDRAASVGAGAAAGATVALGYLVLAVVGRFVFEVSQSAFGAQVTLAPDLVTAVVLLGIVYPVVFGAIGGAAASA